MSIPVYKPSIKRKEMDAVLSCMVSDHIGPGQYSEQFSEYLIQHCDAAGSILLREFERAVELCFRTLGLTEGKEVVLSPLSPGTYLHVIQKLGLIPVFVDVNPATAVPDLDDILDKTGENTAAVILGGVFGYQWDFSEWEDPGVAVIEDVTLNYGSVLGDISAGTIGDAVLMRLEPHDIITTGGGAALLFRKKESLAALAEITAEFDDTILLPDMNAALGTAQIREFDKTFELREEIYQLFIASLQKGKHGFLSTPTDERIIRSSLPVLIKGNRQEIQKYAQKKNVETSLAFKGCCLEEELGDMIVCPVAETLILNCLLFPLYPSLGKSNCESIARILATLP